ncbi:glycine--tRNA ligase subunit beta [Endothiovibrio diazotrophicus]
MSERRDLLVEIGTEELPPKALPTLSRAFGAELRNALTQAGVTHGEVVLYAAPRRLAVLIKEVGTHQPDRVQERRGPAVQAAFDDDGNPTKAVQGFARSCGVEVSALERMETAKGTWLVFRQTVTGQPTRELVPAMVESALAALPIPKRMRWGDRKEEFVRPVHWVVMLLGEELIEGSVIGVTSGRHTRGHRFHHPEPLYLGEAAAYAPLLESEGRVIADFSARREAIRAQAMEAGRRLGGVAVIDEALLDEVTALVEWPVAVAGGYEEKFLEVPAEALISSMEGHQKYFPVVDDGGCLLPHFITIANIESKDIEQVRAGNERVIRPRLSDAAFFWEQDRKHGLECHQAGLKKMVYQDKLGTLFDKSQRVAGLAAHIAGLIGGEGPAAARAAELAKCDLLTQMVFEFPELQGIMGRYYAQHAGEPEEVCAALEEQYWPRFSGDQLPQSPTGMALALADRLDSLTGIFGAGLKPSGDKDPYALRRASLGVLRILVERNLELDLEALLREAQSQLPIAVDVADEVYGYMMERLRGYYHDGGFGGDLFDAVLARRPSTLADFDKRIHATRDFMLLPQAESLAAANKRIRNILKQAEEERSELAPELFTEAAERALSTRLLTLAEEVDPLFDRREYQAALSRLAELRDPVDRFFDEVMVMADDPRERGNRIALLRRMNDLFLRVADLSQIQGN